MQTDVGPVHAASVSVNSYELFSTVLESLALLVSSVLSPPFLLSPLPQNSLSSEGWNNMKTYHTELCVTTSLSLFTLSGYRSGICSHLL